MTGDGNLEATTISGSRGAVITLEAPTAVGVKEIVLDLNSLAGKYKVTPQDIKLLLEEQVGNLLERVGGSPSREAFGNEKAGEIYLVINTFNQPIIRQQIEEQVKFYLLFRNNKAFQNVVAHLTGIIKGKKSEEGAEKIQIIGMIQKATGLSLEDYRKSGKTLTLEQIDTLIKDYQKVIESTGFTHGDLIYGGGAVIWDNIRIDPQAKKLYLIDYQGKRNRPEEPRALREIKETELIPLRHALCNYFGLKA